MDVLGDFLNWAWARHENKLSWYIRPLFSLQFCYFVSKKNVWGMALTVVAVTSSMFWFPAPATPDSRAAAFLALKRRYVGRPWTLGKIVMTALVPNCPSRWRGPLDDALVGAATVIGAGTLLKVSWSFRLAGDTAWVIIPPVALGTAVCWVCC